MVMCGKVVLDAAHWVGAVNNAAPREALCSYSLEVASYSGPTVNHFGHFGGREINRGRTRKYAGIRDAILRAIAPIKKREMANCGGQEVILNLMVKRFSLPTRL